MSESNSVVPAHVSDALAAALAQGEPRALELAYALSLSLPAEYSARQLGLSLTELAVVPPPELSAAVRQVLEEAAQKYDALARGDLERIELSNPFIFAFERKTDDERVLVVNNLAQVPQPTKFHQYTGQEGWDILNRVEFTFPARAQLEEYEFLWLLLE
jgi:hypothetical protein